MDQMRMDPKHQFAAQYVLQRAATERREREALLAAAMSWGMGGMGGMGGMSGMGGMGGMGSMGAGMGMTGSPIHSDASTRISTPAEMKMEGGGLRSPLGQHHTAATGQMTDYGLSRMSGFAGFHSMSAMTMSSMSSMTQSRSVSDDKTVFRVDNIPLLQRRQHRCGPGWSAEQW